MISIEKAKEFMKLEKKVYFNKRKMILKNLIFSYGNNEDIICSVELLEENKKSLLRVPLEFIKEDDSLEYIDAAGFRNLKYLKTSALEIASKFFTEIDRAKFENSQDQLHDLIKILLLIDEELSSIISKNNSR